MMEELFRVTFLGSPTVRARKLDTTIRRIVRATNQLARDRFSVYPATRDAFRTEYPKEGEGALRAKIIDAHERELLCVGERTRDQKIQLLLPFTYSREEMPRKLYAPPIAVRRAAG
ncbi:MAG: hypothetical protein WAN74_00635 [Thermoplasmata archaeon]